MHVDRSSSAASGDSSRPHGSPVTQASVSAVDRRTSEGELDSRVLFGHERRLFILHQGERYTLQVTRAGKLLLTK